MSKKSDIYIIKPVKNDMYLQEICKKTQSVFDENVYREKDDFNSVKKLKSEKNVREN